MLVEPIGMPVSKSQPEPVCILLAGGRGSRLHELTDTLCKPAVAFGRYNRIVDFTLENVRRSNLRQVLVATQYCAPALEAYLDRAWRPCFGPELRLRRASGPSGLRRQYDGTADAVWKNATEIDLMAPREVVVLSADHIYAMDYRPMIAAHRAAGAAVTIAADVVPVADARAFGCLKAQRDGRITDFVEKPNLPPAMTDAPGKSLVSMGIYVFDWAWLRTRLAEDARDAASSHDFGHDILPDAVADGVAQAYLGTGLDDRPFYWRDVGTLDAFRETWLQFARGTPPCDFPLQGDGQLPETTLPPLDRLLSLSVAGREKAYPILPPESPSSGSVLTGTIVMPGAHLADGSRLTRTILAPGSRLVDAIVVGEDPDEDCRWFRVTPGGTTLITPRMLAHREAHRPRMLHLAHMPYHSRSL
jgi:glucose-1-phosphate adenylyltransferase